MENQSIYNQQLKNSFYPLSWASLNQGLETCQTPEQLKNSFGYIKKSHTDEKIRLTEFIYLIQYLVESYQDFNKSNWDCFINKIQAIYPSELENPNFNQLKQKSILKFSQYFPQGISNGPSKITTQATSLPKNINEALAKMALSYQMPLSERLNKVPELGDQKDHSAKAKMLQFILNFLIVESDLINHTINYVDVSIPLIECIQIIYKGCDRVIYDRGEISLYEIPPQIEDTESYASWLQLTPHIYLSFDGNRMFANLKDPGDSFSSKTLEQFLEKFIMTASDTKLKEIARKWIELIQLNQIVRKCTFATDAVAFQRNIELMPLIKEFDKNLSTIESMVPAYQILYEYLNIHFNKIYSRPNDKPCAPPMSELQYLKSIVELVKTKHSVQKNLFDETRKRLFECIPHISKSDPNRLKYAKDLTSLPINISSLFYATTLGPLRPFPDLISSAEEIIVEEKSIKTKSNTEKSAKKTNIQQPKKKKKAPVHYPLNSPVTNGKETKSISNGQTQSKHPTKPSLEITKQLPSANLPVQKEPKPMKTPTQPPVIQNSNSESVSSKIDEIVNKPCEKPFPYQYDSRVDRWDLHEFGSLLPHDQFPEYSNKNLEEQKLIHLFHAPHSLIDQFLHLGIQGAWLNSRKHQADIRYAIPAEITFEGKKHRGLIVYAIDSQTKVCYHRCFTKKLDQEVLYQVVRNTFNENDFPELQSAVRTGPSIASKPKIIDNGTFRIEKGNVVIEDSKRNTTIKLFNTSI